MSSGCPGHRVVLPFFFSSTHGTNQTSIKLLMGFGPIGADPRVIYIIVGVHDPLGDAAPTGESQTEDCTPHRVPKWSFLSQSVNGCGARELFGHSLQVFYGRLFLVLKATELGLEADSSSLYLKRLWEFPELLYGDALKNSKTPYKGVVCNWYILKPLCHTPWCKSWWVPHVGQEMLTLSGTPDLTPFGL